MPRLRIGTLDGTAPGGSESPNPATTTYALWLARSGADWSLELRGAADGDDAGEADAEGDAVIGSIPLTREAAGTRETFSAALVPTADDAGRLLLRWRDHRWAADFHFADPPAPDEGEDDAGDSEADDGPRVANDRESLEFDSDTSAGSRLLRLSERHETAVELPPGARVSVLVWQEQSVEHADFAALAALAEGEVVRLTEAAVLRLRSEAALRFGDVTVPTGNLSPGFAGSYGLWLKRGAGGWRLVFNHEADSWGTQHDPAFDAAEIDVAHSEDGLATPAARRGAPAGHGALRAARHPLGPPRLGGRLHRPRMNPPRRASVPVPTDALPTPGARVVFGAEALSVRRQSAVPPARIFSKLHFSAAEGRLEVGSPPPPARTSFS